MTRPSLPAFALSLGPWGLCLAGACRAPLREEPWAVSRAGSFGVLARAGVWSDYETRGTFEFDANFGDPFVHLTTDLEGRYGGVLGVEYFVLDDVSVLAGYDRRSFEPAEREGLLFDDIDVEEIFLGARALLPWRFLPQGRLRTFVGGKFGYVPKTELEMEFDTGLPGFENPRFAFDGSSSWNFGLSGGLLYQITDHLVGEVSLLYEWPLSSTRDQVEVDFLGFPIVLDSELESRGLIALVGLTWYF